MPSVDLSAFSGFQVPPDVIMLAVRWYLRFGLSYRDLEELLAERGIDLDHVTLFQWVQRFTPLLIDAARPCRHVVGRRWFVDETYVKVAGVWRYVYRAVDEHGQVIDVLSRDAATSPRHGLSSRRRCSRTVNHMRLSPIVPRLWPTQSPSCCPARSTTRSSTRTTGSSATTVDSKHGSDPCAG